MKTETDFINAGYSKKRARELANSPAHNWQAYKGGKRAMPDFKEKPPFTKEVKQTKTL